MPGRLALVGSGEYLPVMQDVEEWLFGDNPRVYVQLATAAAPEGQATLDYWHRLGREAADRLGAEQVIIDVRSRADADDPRWVESIERAGLIYLSGGNPSHLATTLRGSKVWDAIVRTWLAGAGLAGCSAGAMAMATYIQSLRAPGFPPTEGLDIVRGSQVLPHFDRYAKWIPDAALKMAIRDDLTVLGIDEDTALVAAPPDDDAAAPRPWAWQVQGRQSAYVVTKAGKRRIEGTLSLEVSG